MPALRILDKNGIELQPGARLMVRYCVGPYGQTQDDTHADDFRRRRGRFLRSRSDGSLSELRSAPCRTEVLNRNVAEF